MVTVVGYINNLDGTPYEGAIVEAYLNSQMTYDGAIYGNEIYRTVSNSYGKFELDLVPSVVDSDTENYYVFKIVKETTNTYRKIIQATAGEVEFNGLSDFIPRGKRAKLIGDLNNTINPNPVVLPSELMGLFTWQVTVADGDTSSFSAPGEIFLVAVNGVVAATGSGVGGSDNYDYVKTSNYDIEFYVKPLTGSVVAIQYRI